MKDRTVFESLKEDLLRAGEDRAELDFWGTIFDDLTEAEREKLVRNLETELSALGPEGRSIL